ncbi:MAG TPA: hypothetical protein VK576_09590, partial [Thermoleophilia bacterium]|nr:hypothetical protein [Thermoleophilia bacterium]
MLKAVAVAAVLAVLAVVGYGVVHTRAAGGGTAQPAVRPSFTPTPAASSSVSPAPMPHWLVAKAVRPLKAFRHPSAAAPVKA